MDESLRISEEILNKEKHQIPLHELYLELLVEVNPNEKDDENVLFREEKAILQTIIWGALYLESLVNFYCHEMIFGAVKNDENLQKAVWKLVKYASLNRKIEFLLEFKNLPQKLHKPNIKQFNEIFDLRNRLVHFKEPYFESEDFKGFMIKITTDWEVKIETRRPISPIEEYLQKKELNEWRQQILDTGDWLNTCILKEIQRERIDRYYSAGKMDELIDKYGSDLKVILNMEPIKSEDPLIKNKMESTEELGDILEKKYGFPVLIHNEIAFSKEHFLFIMMESDRSLPENERKIPFNLDEMPLELKALSLQIFAQPVRQAEIPAHLTRIIDEK